MRGIDDILHVTVHFQQVAPVCPVTNVPTVLPKWPTRRSRSRKSHTIRTPLTTTRAHTRPMTPGPWRSPQTEAGTDVRSVSNNSQSRCGSLAKNSVVHVVNIGSIFSKTQTYLIREGAIRDQIQYENIVSPIYISIYKGEMVSRISITGMMVFILSLGPGSHLWGVTYLAAL